MICPKCKQDRARRSERISVADHAANFFFFKPYSCHTCRYRFYAFRRKPGVSVADHLSGARFGKNWRRNKRELLIYGFAALAIVAMIYLLAQQHA